MHQRARPRPTWSELPQVLRARVETMLGARVVGSESRPGGWSPGSADRIRLEDGRLAFVKTASVDVNAVSVRLHRREAAVLRLLVGSGAAPELLGEVDEPPWYALIVTDVEGRHPDPSSPPDTEAVLDAVALLPAGSSSLRTIGEDLAQDADAWARLAEDGLPTLPGPVRAAVPARDRLGRGALKHIAGDSTVHLDLRVDNVLIDGAARARIVDWPSAVRGARWVDGLTYLLDVRAPGSDPSGFLDHPLFAGVPAHGVDALLALLGGYFFDSARRPPPPGLEAVRAFQRFQAEVVIDWLRERGAAGLGGSLA